MYITVYLSSYIHIFSLHSLHIYKDLNKHINKKTIQPKSNKLNSVIKLHNTKTNISTAKYTPYLFSFSL